MRPNAVIIE
jgi:hypothetical protein